MRGRNSLPIEQAILVGHRALGFGASSPLAEIRHLIKKRYSADVATLGNGTSVAL